MPMRNNVDDVGFTRALLDDLAKVANVDAKRVFATGISNGGIMCYRLAAELSDRIAAIAPVARNDGNGDLQPQTACVGDALSRHGRQVSAVQGRKGSMASRGIIFLFRGSYRSRRG